MAMGDGHAVKAFTGDPKFAGQVYDTYSTDEKDRYVGYAKAWANHGGIFKAIGCMVHQNF